MADNFLELRGIKKSFGGVQALKGVDLVVEKGEIHCLAGENGCGKSTLIKVVSGAHAADEGDIYIDGKKYTSLSPMEAIRLGIQVIYQDFAVFPNLTVAENIALNNELGHNRKTVNWKEIHNIARKAMDMIGVEIPPDVLVERLSVANKQIVAICRALVENARLVIMDEPTTALTAKEVNRLMDIIRGLQSRGIAVLLVNHKLEEVYDVAQRLTILRNGENVASGRIEEFDRTRFIKAMTGREIDDVFYRCEEAGEEILRVEDLERTGVVNKVSFTLNRGDIFGITGLLGSGRGEIGEMLFGILPMTGGKVFIGGKEIRLKNVDDAIRNKIAYVPEDRLTQGLFLEKSIGMNIVAAAFDKYLKKGIIHYDDMEESMKKWIHELNVLAPSPDPPIKTLSGGNQQKCVLAKWLNTDPRVIILNGPTVGVDVGSKSDIHALLRELAGRGVGVIIISDDLPELLHNCNRIMVMQDGHMTGLVDSQDIDETKLADMLGQ